MAATVTPEQIRAVMSEMGKRSGMKKNKPGRFGTHTPERQAEISRAGVEARKKKRDEKARSSWPFPPA